LETVEDLDNIAGQILCLIEAKELIYEQE
jgi:hypothetical protein